MKGDDRPRPSTPKKKVEGAPPPQCAECQFVFDEDAIKRGQKPQAYKDGDQTVYYCTEVKKCRSRKLEITLGIEQKKSKWLFAKFPRDLLLARMDVRPVDWKETGWLPRYTMKERVLACILYHSWCYPVSLHYAVQLAGTCPLVGRLDADPDEILVDQWRRPRPLLLTDIGRILNEKWLANVSRAISSLVDTKEIRVDEDHVLSPAAKLLEMTIAERRALHLMPQVAGELPDDDAFHKLLKSAPKRFRRALVLIEEREDFPEDLRSDIFREVREACSQFYDRLTDNRTELRATIKSACSRAAYLIPEVLDRRAQKSPSSSSSHTETPPQPESPASEGLRPSPYEQLHTDDEGRGAMRKLDRPRPQPKTDPELEDGAEARVARAVQPFCVPNSRGVRALILRCRKLRHDATVEEIEWFIQQTGPVVKEKGKLMPYLETCVARLFEGATFEEFRAAGGVPAARSMSATAGGGSVKTESYLDRRKREIDAKRNKEKDGA
jgi:hypothetical protein